MLYAIHVLKKDSNEREELYFVLTSKKNVNIETCMFAKYTELCFIWWNLSATTALNFPHPQSFWP